MENKLKRDIGLLSAVAIGIGAVVGAGIFAVTGVAAGIAGPGFLVGLVIAGIAATCNGLSSAQLAAVYPKSGGTYEYGYEVLNPFLGFSAGWMFLASKLSAGGVVALGFGSYFNKLVPTVPAEAAAITAAVLLTAANLFGIKKAGSLNLVIVFISVTSLLIIIIAAFTQFKASNLTPFAPNGFAGIAESAALLFFAYTGYARITTLGEEVKDPRKTIPKAVVLTLGLSVILYAAIGFSAVGAVGAMGLASSSSPLETAVTNSGIPGISIIVGAGASAAMLGVMLSQILGISRMMFAMSRKGDLPKILSKIHPSSKVPHMGIILSGIIIVMLVIVGEFKFIISAASFTILLYYSITNIAALKMKRNEKLYGNIIPVIGLIFCLSLACFLNWKVIVSGILLLAFGHLLRLIFKKLKNGG